MEFIADVSNGEGMKSIDFRVIETQNDELDKGSVLTDLKKMVTELKSDVARRYAEG